MALRHRWVWMDRMISFAAWSHGLRMRSSLASRTRDLGVGTRTCYGIADAQRPVRCPSPGRADRYGGLLAAISAPGSVFRTLPTGVITSPNRENGQWLCR